MKTSICRYQGKIYKKVRKTKDKNVILTSYGEKINNESVLYIAHLGVYHTTVKIEDVDELYDVESLVVYKGLLCDPNSLDPVLLKYNYIYIDAPRDMEPKKAMKYGFKGTDKYNCIYEKKVKLKDIDEIVTTITWIKGEGKEGGTTKMIREDIFKFLEESLYFMDV